MSNAAFSVGPRSLTLMLDGDVHMLDDSDLRFEKIKGLLREDPPKVDEAIKMLDVKTHVIKQSEGRISLDETGVYFEGQELSGYMADRLVAMAGGGYDVKPWMAFMDNLMENPLPEIREDVFKWMEVGKLPITEDGCIVAFKKVRDDYTDVHTGRFSNAVGSVLEMPREQCDTNRNRTCSTGFHFCSADYLSKFSGTRVMIVKVDPRDVTAIPTDYGHSKGRCCRYEVTGELSSQAAARHDVFAKPVMPVDPQEIPDLMAKTPKQVTSRGKGPKSPVGTKTSSRKVAANAAQGKDLDRKSTTKKAPATKTTKKSTAKSTTKKAPATKTTSRAAKPAVKAKVTKTAAKVTKTATKAKTKATKTAAKVATKVSRATSRAAKKVADVAGTVAETVVDTVVEAVMTPPAKKAPARKAAPKKTVVEVKKKASRARVKKLTAAQKTTTGRTAAKAPAKSNAPKSAKKAPARRKK